MTEPEPLPPETSSPAGTVPPPPGSGRTAPPPEPSFVLGLLRDWAIAIGVVLVVFVGYNLMFRPSSRPLGVPAPDFVLSDLDGAQVSLAQVGDLVVLNFWFTTCPPCRREIPELSRYHEAHPEIPMYGVSTDIGMPTARLAAESARLGISYPVLHDVRGEVAQRFSVDSFPTTLVIVKGEIVAARVGALDGATLTQMVDSAR